VSKQLLGIAIIVLSVLAFAVGRLALPAEDHSARSDSLHRPVGTAAARNGRSSNIVLASFNHRQISGMQVTTVNDHAGAHSLRVTGQVGADESRIYRVIAGSDGRLSGLLSTPPGTIVQKGERLATFFNNELVKIQQSYFFSLQTLARVKAGNRSADNRQADESVRANEETLFALGMGEAQVREIANSRQAIRDIDIVSPVTGMVIARNLSPGQRVERGTEMYRIADWSTIWIFVNVPPGEVSPLKPGTRASVVVRETGTILSATVSSAVPLFDEDSRLPQVKLEAQNPQLILRPDMYVEVNFDIPSRRAISVPKTALIDKGLDKIVYVETDDNVFEPRLVEPGSAFGDQVLIHRGLAEGDRVVVSGNFLMDSESRIRPDALHAAVRASR
jgi:Cu(I)/Ag(I) efflux system membrane fusion protein